MNKQTKKEKETLDALKKQQIAQELSQKILECFFPKKDKKKVKSIEINDFYKGNF